MIRKPSILAYASDRTEEGHLDIWVRQVAGGHPIRLTTDPADDHQPSFSPDGSQIVFRSEREEGGSEGCVGLSDMSRDGKKVLFVSGLFSGPSEPYGITAFDLSSGEKTLLYRQKKPHVLADPRFSPDYLWVAFQLIPGEATRRQILIAPLRPTPSEEWIPMTDGTGMDRHPAWSPDGNLLYWISERDGFRCIAARRVDPATKRPLGEMFYVYHLHAARRSMMSLLNPNQARPSVARDKIVFALSERTGNVWMTELDTR